MYKLPIDTQESGKQRASVMGAEVSEETMYIFLQLLNRDSAFSSNGRRPCGD